MKPSTLSRLLKRGLTPSHPGFLREAEKLEAKEAADSAAHRKLSITRGAICELELTQPEILEWLRAEGRAIRLGHLDAVEVWRRGNEAYLAVLKGEQWEVYRCTTKAGFYQLHGRVV